MAEVPFVLLVVLLLNSAAAEDLANGETLMKSGSKPVESKIVEQRHPIAIKQSTSTTPLSRKFNKDGDLAQESVEQAQRRGPALQNNYDFGYAVNDNLDGHQFRQEQMADDGTVHGRFGYRDTKGMFRQVDYMADGYGFRANIRTNEPGTMDLDPANVDIHRIQHVERDHHSYQPRHVQPLKTSAVKQVKHEYRPDEDEEYEDSYESSSEDEEEKNSQSTYDDSKASSESLDHQVPKKNGKAIIYQYFHKKHLPPHGEGQHSTTSSDHENVDDNSSHQQPPHYDISVALSHENDNDKNMEKIPHLTLSGLPQSNHYEQREENIAPKYEENEETKTHKTPKYSKLVKEHHVNPHHGQPHTFTYDPKPPYLDVSNYPVQIKGSNYPLVIHEQIRQGGLYNDPVKAQLYHEKVNPNEHNNHQHHIYAQNKHPADLMYVKHPAPYYPADKYTGHVQYENIDAKHHEQAYVSPQEAEVHHHGLVRDSTYRQFSKSVLQETPDKANEEPNQRPSYRNQPRNKDHHSEHLPLPKYSTEPKYPVKIVYTPAQNPEADSASSYETPIHKKHVREEIVYGFPVAKHVGDDNYEVDHPSYGTINETEEIQNLDTTRTSYPSTHQKQETASPNLHHTSKTYLIVHHKHYGPQLNQERQVKLSKNPVSPKKEITHQRSNASVPPKFAVLFDPSVFKHFDKFRISGKSNAGESKWIPIIPQIKWLPRSSPPSDDWIPMPSRNIRRYY